MSDTSLKRTIGQTDIHVRGYNSIIWVNVTGQDKQSRADKLRAVLPEIFKNYNITFAADHNNDAPDNMVFNISFNREQYSTSTLVQKLDSIIDYIGDEVKKGSSFDEALVNTKRVMNERSYVIAAALQKSLHKPVDFRYVELSRAIDAEVEIWKKAHHKENSDADDLCAALHAGLSERYMALRTISPDFTILFSDEVKPIINRVLEDFGLSKEQVEEIREAIMAKTAVLKHDERGL